VALKKVLKTVLTVTNMHARSWKVVWKNSECQNNPWWDKSLFRL